MTAPDDRQAGFTLLEMLVTMAIFAMVVAAGAATLARRDLNPTPEQSARQLQGLLLRARSDAIRQGGDAVVVVDAAGPSVAYPPAARPVRLPGGTALEVRAAVAAPTADGRAAVIFRADGSASGAELTLTDAKGRRAGVAVDWFTGLPRLTGP